jgi:hypothetical protein
MRLKHTGNHWQGELRIQFGLEQGEVVSPITEFQITDTGISFVQSQGITNGLVKYEGQFTGDSLDGRAQIILNNGAVFAIGGWTLKRQK